MSDWIGCAKIFNMNETKLTNLNYYCLFQIFDCIKKNCITSNIKISYNVRRYSDLISFATSCKYICEAFKEWDFKLYEQLKIDKTFFKQITSMEIYLEKLYDHMRFLPAPQRKLFWKEYINEIKGNNMLESVKIFFEPTQYYPEHLEAFDDIINALRHKSVREFVLSIKGKYKFDISPEFRNLESLYVDADMDVDFLIGLCKSNPNLTRLKLNRSELYDGQLAYIVPHCGQLEYLTFVMKPGINGREYGPLAALPKLLELTLHGNHQSGSLVWLFEGLRGSKIRKISIPNTHVTRDEVMALAQIPVVATLQFCLLDRSHYQEMPMHGYLTEIIVMLEPKNMNTSIYEGPQWTATLRSDWINTTREPGVNFYNHWNTKEELLFEKSRDYEFIQSYRLRVKGTNKIIETLKNFDEKLFVEKMVLNTHEPLSQEEMAALGSISTITTIRCFFSQMEAMIAVKLQQLGNTEAKTLNRVDRITTEKCELRLIHGQDSVTLAIHFNGIFMNTAVFAPLLRLNNLKCLSLEGRLMYISFEQLFRTLSLDDEINLEELQVDFVDAGELEQIVKIRSLKVLKCGFLCSKNIDKVANLGQLESLTITFHPEGSLVKLLFDFASKEIQTLCHLAIQHTAVIYEEMVELTKIKSLKSIQLGLRSENSWLRPHYQPRKIEVLYCVKCTAPKYESTKLRHHTIFKMVTSSQPTKLKALAEMYARSEFSVHFTDSCFDLLENLPNLEDLRINFERKVPDLERISRLKNLRRLSVASQDFRNLSQLETLECVVYDMQGIENVALLQNISELQIHNPTAIELWDLLKELKALVNMKSLLLDNCDLNFLELVEITKLKWINHLRLGIADKKYIFMFLPSNLPNLTDLEITSTECGNAIFVLSYITMSKILKSLSLYRYYGITVENVNGILMALKLQRDPEQHPPLKLRGIWSDFDRVNQVSF
ncbi:hypothetical protein KR026_010144 [Drosophila bipectinata]|nr:hypothetical protein KR026_010144 [Drosophila bipectinata]